MDGINFLYDEPSSNQVTFLRCQARSLMSMNAQIQLFGYRAWHCIVYNCVLLRITA